MKKVLVFGASGLLGHHLMKMQGYEVFGTVRTLSHFTPARIMEGVHVDMEKTVRGAIDYFKPNVIINAAGIIKQMINQHEVHEVYRVNSVFSQWLGMFAVDLGIPVIHISTDCVFNGVGDRKSMRNVHEIPDARDLYGLSKIAGEIVDKPGVVTLRTSFIGPELRGNRSLFEWVMANKGMTVNGYTNAWFNGLMVDELVRAISHVIQPLLDGEVHGLFQVTGDRISKFDLINKLNIAYDLGMTINPLALDRAVDRSLDPTKFEEEFEYKAPSWDRMIENMK